MKHGLNMGWGGGGRVEIGAEEFAVKGTVVLVRSNSVAEVFG